MSDPHPTFETALEELEAIVEALEGGELSLDEALALFEQGVARLRQASRMLNLAHGRVEELLEDAAGDLSVIGVEDLQNDGGEADD